MDTKNIEGITALTPMQEGMLFHYLQDSQSENYFEQLSLEISGEIDRDIFEKAWNLVAETNEMLRTVFRWEKLEIDKERLSRIFGLLISRHESLRTGFVIIDEEPVQRVYEEVGFKIENENEYDDDKVELAVPVSAGGEGSDGAEAFIRGFIRAFALSQAP